MSCQSQRTKIVRSKGDFELFTEGKLVVYRNHLATVKGFGPNQTRFFTFSRRLIILALTTSRFLLQQPTVTYSTQSQNLSLIHILTINKTNNTHTYKIYRKPTTTDMIIHNTSNHPTQHKHAAFNHMLHRLTDVYKRQRQNTVIFF